MTDKQRIKLLRKIQKETGWSNLQLAEKLGVHRMTLYRWLHTDPSLLNLIPLARQRIDSWK